MAVPYFPYVGPIVTRAAASEVGEHLYFDGRPCSHGHLAQRYTRNFGCVACVREDNIRRNPPHPVVPLASSIETMLGNAMPIPESGCWAWLGGMLSCGYGYLKIDGKNRLAHRIAYELAIGPIPDGLQIDHLCRVRSCINPNHLEPVTQQVNIRRGDAGKATGARNRAKTHCLNGHPFSGANLYIKKSGARGCRACHRDRMRRLKCT